MQLTIENVTSVLHQGSSQLHDEKVLLKKRTTIGAIQVLFFSEFFFKNLSKTFRILTEDPFLRSGTGNISRRLTVKGESPRSDIRGWWVGAANPRDFSSICF